MIELKTVIDENGYIVDNCVEIEDGKINNFTIKDGQKTVTKYSNALRYVKPKWNDSKWIEGATEEEIQAWKEENKVVEREPSENETLLSTILLENAELKQKTDDLEEMTATLMLRIAELKGDSTNV